MQPVRRVARSSRNLLIISGAIVGGIIVGGVSVLGVALAVIEPPSHDAPAGSAVFDGQPHVVQQAPTALSAALQTAAASPAPITPTGTWPPGMLQAHPVTPIEAQAVPPAQQQTPAQVLDKTWPDAPPARPPRAPQSTAAAPSPNPPASNVASNGQSMTTRIITPYNYLQTAVVPSPDTTKRRVVAIPDNTQQPREDAADAASTGSSSRPLFDFFGTFGDERQRDDRNAVSVPPQPQFQPQPRAWKNPRDPQLVIRRRQDSDDDNQEAVNSSPSPQYDSWDNFFGYSRNDNWHN
jgi:hypothetical protein